MTHEPDCNGLARCYSRALLLLTIAGLLTACGGGGGGGGQAANASGSSIGLTDSGIHPPPTSGTYAYNTFTPLLAPGFPAVGGTYTDPVFGAPIKRLTDMTGNSNDEDIYAKHQANANGTRAFHRVTAGVHVIDVNTGTIVYSSQPEGLAAHEMHWDALDPDKYYYFDGPSLMRRNLTAQTSSVIRDFGPEVTTGTVSLSFMGSTGTITRSAGSFVSDGFVAGSTIIVNGATSNNGAYTISTVAAFVITVDTTVDVLVDEGPVNASITTALQANGGSLNIQTRDGRYFTVRYNGTNKVWDSQSDVIYSGSVTPSDSSGWVSITPDGNYLVNAGSGMYSTFINHTTRELSTTPVMFWNLCGDHGALISASDGKSYMITFNCSNDPAVYRVDITLDQAGNSETEQSATNQRLVPLTPDDAGHFSAVSKGVFADWVFVSTESVMDLFDSLTTGWTPYKQEIIAVNVLTFEIRRLAHHRSRSITDDYYYTPRVSSSWDGSVVMWTSNYNHGSPTGYSDLYAIQSPL